MTAEHLIFIPAVFLFGFAAGAVIVSKWRSVPATSVLQPTSVSNHPSDMSGKKVLATLALFLTVFVITHIIPIPNGVVHVQELSSGQPLFDQSPEFDSEQVYNRLEQFGDDARAAYQTFLFTTDLIFPLSFLVFLSTFFRYSIKKGAWSAPWIRALFLLPFVWFSLDMLENSMVFVMIEQFPRPTSVLADVLGYVTVSKFSLLLASLLISVSLWIFTLAKSSIPSASRI